MAANSLSQVTSPVKSGNPIHIDFLNGETPVVLSTDVARHFQRRHSHILRDIDRLRSILPKSFCEPNFGLTYNNVHGPNGGIRQEKAYLLTRDAFSLLVMGMTGKAAIVWKLRYIEAFNALEAAALKYQADLAREAGYMQGRDETLALPVMEAERKKGYLEGLKEGRKFRASRDGLHVLGKILSYREKGLSFREMGKLLGVSKDAAYRRLARARKYGLVPIRPVRPVQGSLLTDGVASGSEQIAKAARSSRLCRVNMDATPEREKEVGA